MHAHSLFRLSAKVYNTPHLITPDSFGVVLDYFDRRNSDGFKLEYYEDTSPENEDEPKPYCDGIGVLNIDGSLTYKPVVTMCGEVGTSYQDLVEDVQEMADAGVKTIIMKVTSGGGEASHCFETAQEIRSICDENEITLIGYADTIAASAAYALICICDQVFANPSASLGSIGCVVCLMDDHKMMDKMGLKRIFITSGESKVPFADDGSFKKEFLDELQGDVDRLNLEFAEHVSRYTGLDVADIMAFEAKCFDAKTAVEKGLANAVMTNREFSDFVAQVHKGIS